MLFKTLNRKNKIKTIIMNLLNFICFVLILAFIANKISWIYRGNSIESRQIIAGFNTVEGDVDVVFIGSSEIMRSYMPLQAYKDYGYTSYNYATSSASFNMIKYYIEEASKHKKPQLYVISGSLITALYDSLREMVIRNWSDSLDVFSTTRMSSIATYMESIDTDVTGDSYLAFYYDLAKYHNDSDTLNNRIQYDLAFNRYHNVNKGFNAMNSCDNIPFQKPDFAEGIIEYDDKHKAALYELLDYCKKADLNILFLFKPCIDTSQQMVNNYTKKILTEYGYDYIDTNDYIDEMGLDYETDFLDPSHENYCGAEKFSSFVSGYIKDNYDLPDHRGKSGYEQWDLDYNEFSLLQDIWKSNTENQIKSHLDAKEIGIKLAFLYDVYEYINYLDNDNFTVIIEKNRNINSSQLRPEEKILLNKYGILSESNNQILYYIGSDLQEPNESDNATYMEYQIGTDIWQRGKKKCIAKTGNEHSIVIDNMEYVYGNTPVNIVVFDNNYLKVVDSIGLETDADGHVVIRRNM